MENRKILAAFIAAAMLISALCVCPITVSAETTAGGSFTTSTSAALATSPISIDGKIGEGEFWTTMTEPTLTMTTWADNTGNTAYTNEVIDEYTAEDLDGFGVSHTVKIANDSEYVYVLYETTKAGDSVGFQIGFNGATGTDGEVGEWIWFLMKQDVQNGGANTSTVRTFRSSYTDDYTDKDSVWHGVVARNTYTAKETGTGIFEVRFPIPDSVRQQLLEGNVNITFTGNTYSKHSVMDGTRPSTADWTCGFVLPGFSTDGTNYPNGNTPATVTLQKAERMICEAVENVLGKSIKIDGEMKIAEGWSLQPYAVLDTHDATAYNLNKNITNKVTDVPTVRISTDGEKLYFFIEVTGGDMLTTDQWNLLYLLVDFSEQGGDKYGFELFLSAQEGVYVCGETEFTGTPGDGSPFRNFALNGETVNTSESVLRTDTVVANKIVSEQRNFEISMPIPENMQTMVTDDGLDCGIGIYVRDTGNEGYTTPNLQLNWSGTTLGTTTFSNVGERRPTYAGVQCKTYTSETDANKKLVDVRFAATLKDEALAAGTAETCAFKEVGYDITYGNKTVTVNCYNIYKSLISASETEMPSKYGNGDFFFCYAIRELEVNRTYNFSIRAWTHKDGEVRVYTAETYQAVIAIDANGVATIKCNTLT